MDQAERDVFPSSNEVVQRDSLGSGTHVNLSTVLVDRAAGQTWSCRILMVGRDGPVAEFYSGLWPIVSFSLDIDRDSVTGKWSGRGPGRSSRSNIHHGLDFAGERITESHSVASTFGIQISTIHLLIPATSSCGTCRPLFLEQSVVAGPADWCDDRGVKMVMMRLFVSSNRVSSIVGVDFTAATRLSSVMPLPSYDGAGHEHTWIIDPACAVGRRGHDERR